MMMAPFHPYGDEARIFDLGSGFHDSLLSDAGELEVSPEFRYPIFIRLGEATLKLFRIPVPATPGNEGSKDSPLAKTRNLYTIVNPVTCDVLFLDDAPTVDSTTPLPTRFKERHPEVRQGQSLIISRDTTPELGLPDTADNECVQLRIGTLRRNLHFMDPGSDSGTTVALHQRDESGISTPSKLIKTGPNPAFEVAIAQRWRRY